MHCRTGGIGFWKGKVYAATWDGRLIAIDAGTGKEVWRVRTFEEGKPLYITGAPKSLQGQGADRQRRHRKRTVTRLRDGLRRRNRQAGLALLHRPRQSRRRLRERSDAQWPPKTWTGQWWIHGGGGNAVAWLHLRCRARSALHRHRQRLALEPEDPQPRRRRQPVPLLDRGAQSRYRRVHVALPDDARRDLGLTIRTWTSCWPTCRSKAASAR